MTCGMYNSFVSDFLELLEILVFYDNSLSLIYSTLRRLNLKIYIQMI